jgi:hypothetical protein
MKQWVLFIVMRSKMIVIWAKAKGSIKNNNRELWSAIKTTYPAAQKVDISINEMVELLIYCA